MAITVSRNELKIVIDKLDDVKLEILRLRATLLSQEEPTEEEKRRWKRLRKK
jgi:hypothetical protein